jgi:hypothetical protein
MKGEYMYVCGKRFYDIKEYERELARDQSQSHLILTHLVPEHIYHKSRPFRCSYAYCGASFDCGEELGHHLAKCLKKRFPKRSHRRVRPAKNDINTEVN